MELSHAITRFTIVEIKEAIDNGKVNKIYLLTGVELFKIGLVKRKVRHHGAAPDVVAKSKGVSYRKKRSCG